MRLGSARVVRRDGATVEVEEEPPAAAGALVPGNEVRLGR